MRRVVAQVIRKRQGKEKAVKTVEKKLSGIKVVVTKPKRSVNHYPGKIVSKPARQGILYNQETKEETLRAIQVAQTKIITLKRGR